MGHAFFHPLTAFERVPGGWELRDDTGVLGVLVREPTGKFTCWAKRGENAVAVGSSWDLPNAAVRLWNATHGARWGGL